MRFLKTVLFALFLTLSYSSFAQVTYTTNGTCSPTQTNYLTTASCWVKTGTCNDSNRPPVNGTTACPVIIEINHTVNLASLNLDNFVTLKVNSTGALNISGDITQAREVTSNIIVDGGSLNVTGKLTPTSGRNNNPETILNITLLNEGEFNIGFIDMDNRTVINIDGDQTSNVVSNQIDLGNVATINILQGGGLIVNNETSYQGNSSSINVFGYFETNSLSISGGGQTELNVFGNAQVTVKGDVKISGDSKMSFGGDSNVLIEGDVDVRGTNSGLTLGENNTTKVDGSIFLVGGGTVKVEGFAELDVDGNLEVDGNSQFEITGEAGVYVCGTRPVGNVVDSNGKTRVKVTLFCQEVDPENPLSCANYDGCRLLPVEFIYTKTQFNSFNRSNAISWATGKEWENSHFEIERSVDNINDFRVIGTVEGMGFKDTITEYEFEDMSLPFTESIVYYRIKQFDFNGKSTTGKVVSVRIAGSLPTGNIWKVYPNPLVGGDHLNIKLTDFKGYNGELIAVRVVSSTAMTYQVQAKSESELNEVLGNLINRIPKGVLMIEIQWGQKVEHFKLLKK